MKKMVVYKMIVVTRLALSFLASILICSGIFAVISYFTLCDGGFVQEQLFKTNYVEYLTQEVNQALEYYAGPSGFDEEFFSETLTVHDIEAKVSDSIFSAFNNGKKFILLDNVYKDVIYQKMVTTVKAETGTVSKETDTALKALAEKCNLIYTNYISSLYLSQFGIIMHSLSKYLLFGGILFLAAGIGIMLGVIFLCKRHRTRRYYFYLTGTAAGIMTVALPAVILIGRFASRLSIASQSLYYGIVGFSDSVLRWYISVGVVFMLIIQVLMFASKKSIQAKREKRRT